MKPKKSSLKDHYLQLIEFVLVLILVFANYFLVQFILNPKITSPKINRNLKIPIPTATPVSDSLNQVLFNQIQSQRATKILYDSSYKPPSININNPF